MEVWKSIDGYEGYYEVSNYGRVRSLDRYIDGGRGVDQLRKGRMKAQRKNEDGYYTVKLSKDGNDRWYFTHRLVAAAFIPQDDMDSLEVNHKDFDRTNNHVENLEWVTHTDNVAYTKASGRHVSDWRDMTGENNPNYGNHTLSERYSADKELAKQKQGRPGARNGRAQSVVAFDILTGWSMDFGTLQDCASYLIDNKKVPVKSVQTLANTISKSAKQGKTYRNYNFSI